METVLRSSYGPGLCSKVCFIESEQREKGGLSDALYNPVPLSLADSLLLTHSPTLCRAGISRFALDGKRCANLSPPRICSLSYLMCIGSEEQHHGFDSASPYWVDSSAQSDAVSHVVDIEAAQLRVQICSNTSWPWPDSMFGLCWRR